MERVLPEKSEPTATLCFPRDVFMKENFSVDTFVSEHRKHASLEKLRDDLGIHLKFLRSSMIELINKDYADFVNLSANLVGLDKFIKNISQPLEQLKQEVNDVKATVDDILKQSQEQLEKRRKIREKKALIQHAKFVCKSVEKVERLLPPLSADGTRSWNNDQVEQLATEVNQILFYLEKCYQVKLAGEMAQRVDVVTSALQQHLEASFLRSINADDPAELSSVLHVCATIDRVTSMEELFRKKVVAPVFRDIVSEKVIQESGLEGVYSQVVLFVSTRCQGLLNVTVSTPGMGDTSTVSGYDFLSHAVWPELAMLLETRAPLVFAAGNPDQFHARYSSTMEFLDRFELACRTAEVLIRLRNQPSYQTFLAKWNLPVYFQLRFQDIASQLEACLLQPLQCSKAGSEFHTSCYEVLWEQLQRCWNPNVFLTPLAHRFWKLTLQLLSRHRQWLTEFLRDEGGGDKQGEKGKEASPVPESTDSFTAPRQANNEASETVLLVLLSCDTELLVEKVMYLFTSIIKPKLQRQGFTCFNALEESISECSIALKELEPNISKRIVNDTARTCCSHLKLVNDIPRLYRRTNKEVPTKPSSYIHLILEPLVKLKRHVTETLKVQWNADWTRSVLEEITQQYLTVTNDVLVSVKKMEDSLKRLKRGRDRTPLPEGAASDDDKIRLQLYLDVKCFSQKMEELGIPQSSVPSYGSLLEVVEAARSSPTL
uniref:Conserved oligomeric Golgi complex subunit 2 n=1 Tax=Ornithodoros turicata TaxID=34597 RepID=A0A2R5LMQ4_9ACAR